MMRKIVEIDGCGGFFLKFYTLDANLKVSRLGCWCRFLVAALSLRYFEDATFLLRLVLLNHYYLL